MENLAIYINFFILGAILIYFFNIKIISKNILILLLITNLFPIIINLDVSVYNKFPDQGGYQDNISIIRNNFDFDNLRHNFESQFLVSIFQIIPIPFINNTAESSYINRFLLCLFLIYLIKNKYLKNDQILILILYPSFIFYSSLFIKETIVIILISYSYIKLKEKNFSFSFFFIFLAFLIKPFLAILFFKFFIIYILINFFEKKVFVFCFLLIIFVILLYPEIFYEGLDFLNLQIYNFESEKFGYSSEIELERNKLLLNFDLIIYFLQSIPDFWLRPYLYETSKIIHTFQFFENLIVLSLFLYLLNKIYSKNKLKFFYLIYGIIFISLPFGLIVANAGTLSRYRFAILAIFLIILFYELNLQKKKMKPLKLLYLINHKSFFVSHRLKIALAAGKENFYTFLICGKDSSKVMKKESLKIIKKLKINYKEVESSGGTISFFYDLFSITKLFFLIRSFKPSLIHIASPKFIILAGLAARIYGKAPIILSISGLGYLFTKKSIKIFFLSILFSSIIKILINFKKCIVIVQNKNDYYYFKNKLNIQKEKIKIIRGSGVDINKFTNYKKNKNKIILFPARLLLNKGIIEFIEAAKIIRKKFKDWFFVICGASDYTSPELISKTLIENAVMNKHIKYIGYVPQDKMPTLLSKSSIVCLPSYREGMPMVLQEAAASGLPIVTTNVVGCRESIINNKTGFLVEPKNVDDLVEKLTLLIKSNFLRKKFGNEGRKFAIKNFNEKKIIKQNIKLYKSLLKYE